MQRLQPIDSLVALPHLSKVPTATRNVSFEEGSGLLFVSFTNYELALRFIELFAELTLSYQERA